MFENNKSNFVKSLEEKIRDRQENSDDSEEYDTYLTRVNRKTGKVIFQGRMPHKGLGTGWFALYQQAIREIAKAHLPDEQNRVFMFLLSELDFGNYITVSQKEMSQELNMKQPNIAKAMKALKELNIIAEGPRYGLTKSYRLNPFVAHKGRERDQTVKETLGTFDKLTLIKGGKDK